MQPLAESTDTESTSMTTLTPASTAALDGMRLVLTGSVSVQSPPHRQPQSPFAAPPFSQSSAASPEFLLASAVASASSAGAPPVVAAAAAAAKSSGARLEGPSDYKPQATNNGGGGSTNASLTHLAHSLSLSVHSLGLCCDYRGEQQPAPPVSAAGDTAAPEPAPAPASTQRGEQSALELQWEQRAGR